MSNEFGTFSKEVAIHLDINPSTLRRWASELEKQGYKFERNDKIIEFSMIRIYSLYQI